LGAQGPGSYRSIKREIAAMRAAHLLSALALIVVLLSPIGFGHAQTPAEFYRGKTISLEISSSVGGGYDIHARLLARHMPKYIPGNPVILPKNVDGAGGLRLANLLYNTAPRDGTALGIIYRSTAFEPLFGNKAAQFDATKFTWIGSASNEVSVCVAWHTSGVATIEDLRTKELLVGTTGPGADTYQFTNIINGVFGTRMKRIGGYPGGNEIVLAMERGEVGGRCGWSWSSVKATHMDWLTEKKMTIFLQMALRGHPDLAGVPLILDLAKTAEQRDIIKLVFARQVVAWPYLAPPGLPPERTATLRRAFLETMQDKDFLSDAAKAKLEIMPVAGEDIQKLVGELYATPATVVAKTAEMIK
jgi:tripartite-type tricarboxylate transporter receptor subunit TctC